MKLTESIVFAGYYLVCIGIAIYFRRRAARGETAYWGAERSIGAFVNAIGLFATLVSAASYMGFLGLAYRLGWSLTTVSFGVGSALGFVLCMLLSGGPLRRFSEMRGKYTLSGFLSERYNVSTGLITTVFVLILFPAFIVPQLMGAGLATKYLLGIEFTYAVILAGVVYAVYVLLGGMLSVTWTDFIQGIMMFVMMVGLSLVAIFHFGGTGPLLDKALAINPNFLRLHPRVSPWTYLGMTVGVLTFVLSSPHVIMRFFVTKNVNQGRAALSLTAFLTLAFHLLGYLGVAAAGLVIAPKLANIDNTYIVVMDELFSPLFRGLAVAAILAAIMSTASGMLLAAGAEFSNNVYKRFFRPDANEAQTLYAGRVIITLIGILTTVLAVYQTQTIGVIVGLVVEGAGSAFMVPLLAGLWWKRANAAGGLLSMSGGFLAFLVVHFMKGVPLFAEILISLPVSLVLMIVGSLATAPPPREKVQFVEALHRAAA